jgi:predicted ATPase
MRIDYLEIKSRWKNLEGFKIDFDQSRDVTVLLGRNGSAKSNLIEAIITIFINLDLKDLAPFAYFLKYEINGQKVVLDAEEGKQPKAEVNQKHVNLAEFREKWMPNHVVCYYSGSSDRFEQLFYRHYIQARSETLVEPKKKGLPSKLAFRRFIYALPMHSQFVLLAFYYSEDRLVKKFLKELPRIEAFDSALLTIHRPLWTRTGAKASDFWGALGPVRELLERIRKYSLAPFTRSLSVSVDFARRQKLEMMHLYLPDLEALYSIASEYGGDPGVLFQALDTMRLSYLIEDFRVRVRVRGADNALHTRQLSEGEQQLLAVIGLMRFTRDENSLYLLDEPDTHLHPSWSLEYLEYLRRIGGIDRKSHTIITTHDPLLASGLCKEEIRLLSRTQKGGIVSDIPEESPRGRGVAAILTSELYGLDSQLDQFSLRVLNRIYEVSFWDPSPKRTRHLRRLKKLVPSLDAVESSPDPYRNIARSAFQIAQDNIVGTDNLSDRKSLIIEKLAKKLYEESSKETK